MFCKFEPFRSLFWVPLWVFFRINKKVLVFFSSPSSTYFCSCFGVSKARVAVFLPYKKQTVFYSLAISTLHVKDPGILLTVQSISSTTLRGNFRNTKMWLAGWTTPITPTARICLKPAIQLMYRKTSKCSIRPTGIKQERVTFLHLYTL